MTKTILVTKLSPFNLKCLEILIQIGVNIFLCTTVRMINLANPRWPLASVQCVVKPSIATKTSQYFLPAAVCSLSRSLARSRSFISPMCASVCVSVTTIVAACNIITTQLQLYT